jgi:hypothetical protein
MAVMSATKGDGKWYIKGYDAFDESVSSFFSLPGEWESQGGAEAAAAAKLEEFKKQSKGIIWDQVFIVRPDGSMYRYAA